MKNRNLLTAEVVDGSKNRPDLHFPPRIKAKISEYASNFNVQITLSFLVIRIENTPDFILPPGSSGKNFRFFINSPQTLNLVIKLKFPKKSEIFGFEKFYKNYFIFFLFKKWKKVIKI